MKSFNSFLATFSAILVAGSASAANFDAELQCSVSEAQSNGTYGSKILTKAAEGNRLSAEINQEIVLKNGHTYSVSIKGFADSLTTNTTALTLSQSVTIQEKDGAFKTSISTGPTMFRMESFSDIALGFFNNQPGALCNMFNCSEVRADIGVSHDGSISVTCQIRGKAQAESKD